MLTDEQKTRFVNALEAAGLGVITEDDVVATRDTVADFAAHHHLPKSGSQQQRKVKGITIHSFWQRGRRGEKMVHIADFGDVRAVLTE